MPTIYYVSTTGSNINNGTSSLTPKLTIAAAITAASNGDTILVNAGTYRESVLVNKSVTLRGANYNVASSTNGIVRSSSETIVQGHLTNAGNCFTITADNVEVNGFKCYLPTASSPNVRDAFNIQLAVNEVAGTTTERSNVSIKYNVIVSGSTTNQRQSLVLGEGTDSSKTNQAGKGRYNNIVFNNNYIDFSASNSSVRGILFTSYYSQMTYDNVEISSNYIKHSTLSANTPLGSYFGYAVTRPIYYNGLKIQNNTITNAPLATAIRGIFDMDSTSIISGNNITSRNGTWINFRQTGGIIQNNTFNVSHPSSNAVGLWIADGQYSNSEPQEINATGNTFIKGTNTVHVQLDTSNVNIENIINNNTFDGIVKTLLAQVNYTKNSVNYSYSPVVVYPTIQQAINAGLSNGIVTIYPGTYIENILLGKSLTIQGIDRDTTIVQSDSNASRATIQLTDGSTGSSIKNITVKGRNLISSTTGSGDSDNNKSGIYIYNTNTTNNPEINDILLEDLIIKNASNGLAINNKHSNNITIRNSTIEDNEGSGIRIASNTETMNGFNVEGCTIQNNNLNAITTNPSGNYRPNCTNYAITNTLISNNNKLTVSNSHDVSIFGFNGNISITNTDINSNHLAFKQLNGTSATIGGWGMIIYGFKSGVTTYNSGNITLSNVNLSGTVIKSGLGIERFLNIGTISMQNVNLKDYDVNKAGQTWPQLTIGHDEPDKKFNLGNIKLKTLAVTQSGDIDARNAVFYNKDTGVFLNKSIPEDLIQILSQIIDKITLNSLGSVLLVNNSFQVSPTSQGILDLINELNTIIENGGVIDPEIIVQPQIVLDILPGVYGNIEILQVNFTTIVLRVLSTGGDVIIRNITEV